MKKRFQTVVPWLSAILIVCVLLAGLFCVVSEGARPVKDLQAEETFWKSLEEECLSEESHDFPGAIFVSEDQDLYTSRRFVLSIDLTAGSSAVCFHDRIIPLRI